MIPDRITNDEDSLAKDILVYLTGHPDAQDTKESIMEWWSLEQQIKREGEKVKEALAALVAKGFVSERKDRQSRHHYRINHPKMKAIQRFLAGTE